MEFFESTCNLLHQFSSLLQSHGGGERAAIIYSLLGTCKLQGIDPSKWLDDVLRRITDHPQDKLNQLLPQF